jgi:hypothetical protein
MTTYYAICAGISTLSLLIGMAFLSVAAFEMGKTAKSVRKLSDHVDERVEAFKTLGDVVSHFSRNVQSGWMRGAEIAVGLITAMRQTFSPGNGREAALEEENEVQE